MKTATKKKQSETQGDLRIDLSASASPDFARTGTTILCQPFDSVASAYYVDEMAIDDGTTLEAHAEPAAQLTVDLTAEHSAIIDEYADMPPLVHVDNVARVKRRLREGIRRRIADRIATLRSSSSSRVPVPIEHTLVHDEESEMHSQPVANTYDQRHITINVVIDGHRTHLV